MKHFKLGRKPIVFRKRLHLAKYLNRSVLPTTSPLNLGSPIVSGGMLCNGPSPLNPPQIAGGVGCCFWAAALRAAVARANSAGKSMDLTQPWAVASVLEGYASTGFDINNPDATDQGTDPDQGFSYLHSTGIRMQDGTFDRMGVPVAVDPKDFDLVCIAHNLFGGTYVGISFPSSWEDASVWDATTSPYEGGHEVCSLSDMALAPNGLEIDTWGETRIITPAGLSQCCDQLTVVVDPAFFGPNGTNLRGFDAEQLVADEAAL